MATPEEILLVLARLCKAYPNYALQPPLVDTCAEVLADLPAPILLAAAMEHIGRSAFFPSAGELREAACGLIEAAQSVPDPYQAWADVKRAMKQIGHKGEPQFSHPLIGEVVELFGWVDLCQSDNLVADRAHFTEAYQRRFARYQSEQRRLPSVQQALLAYRAEHLSLPPGE